MSELKENYDNYEELLSMNLLVNMRIYDALLVILNEKNPNKAQKLQENHKNGEFVADFPWL